MTVGSVFLVVKFPAMGPAAGRSDSQLLSAWAWGPKTERVLSIKLEKTAYGSESETTERSFIQTPSSAAYLGLQTLGAIGRQHPKTLVNPM